MNEPSELPYFNFRDHLADDLRRGDVGPEPAELVKHTADCAGVDMATAAEWVERFVKDSGRHLKNRTTP